MTIEQLEKRVVQLEEVVEQQKRDITDLQQALSIREKIMKSPVEQVVSIKKDEETEENFFESKPVAEQSATEPELFFGGEEPVEITPEEINLKRAYDNLHRDTKKETGKKDIEKRVGGMMGVVASLMIFVSIILFVTMVYAAMNPFLKVLCIFVFSGVILGIGLVAMRKSLNGFTMSITGCGMGAIYLSLFITHIFFGMINQVVLYILLLVWATAAYYFLGKKYVTFKIIGQVGITISVLFGVTLFGLKSDMTLEWPRMVFLMIYFMAASWFYLLADRQKNGRGTTACIILDEIAVGGFWILLMEGILSEVLWLRILFVVFLIVNGLFFLWTYVTEAENRDGSLSLGWYVLLLLSNAAIFDGAIVEGIENGLLKLLLSVIAVGGLLCIELMRKRKDCWHFISVAVIYILLLVISNHIVQLELRDGWTGVFYGMYALGLIWVGYHFEDSSAIYLSYGSVLLATIFAGDAAIFWVTFFVCIVTVGTGGYFLYTKAEAYQQHIKILFYITLQLIMGIFVARICAMFECYEHICIAWAYIMCAIVSVYGCSRYFTYSFVEKDELENNVLTVTAIVNGILMFFGSILMYDKDQTGVLGFLVLAATAAIYMVNIKTSYVRFGDVMYVGFYNGFKLSLFVLLALKAYELSGPIISIAWIVLAILIIAVGFRMEFKYLRVYGLGLTMFAICKLLIFDIDYGNPAVRAFSCMLSGVLCFVINLIYHKMQQNDKE